jgi:hypothetical protein
MSKIITTSFAINKGKSFFNDKKAKTLTKLNNMNGDEIEKGAIVTITGRGDTKSLFNIEDEKGVIIRNTWCENLELED